MKLLPLLLCLSFLPIAAQAQSSSSTLAAVNKLIKEQQVALKDSLDARNKAEADRLEAIKDAQSARTEAAVQGKNIELLTENRDQWEARAEWYRKDNDRLAKIEAKYKAMSARVNWVAFGAAALVGALAAILIVFYSGGIAFSVPWVVLAVGGGTGAAVFAAIQLLFRLT